MVLIRNFLNSKSSGDVVILKFFTNGLLLRTRKEIFNRIYQFILLTFRISSEY